MNNHPAAKKPLRIWPGAILAILQVLLWFVVPRLLPDRELWGLLGTVVAAVAILLWWIFFSRAPWVERLGAIVLIFAAIFGMSFFVHVSVLKAGQGRLFYAFAFLLSTFALAVSAAASQRLAPGLRRLVMAAAVLLACGGWTLFRSEGIMGSGPQLVWRWTPTAEERLLAQTRTATAAPTPVAAPTQSVPAPSPGPGKDPAAPPAAEASGKREPTMAGSASRALPALPATAVAAEWPGFRGPNRDSVIHGVRITTDWATARPVELWRRAVGPGWSSFAVRGDLIYTQEQRGEFEIVACYNATTGKPVWEHRDAARFWEANGGAGPRGTPTLHGDRVYTFGATGILNALDANTGAVLWSRNAGPDTEKKVPYWGFSSSPLVVGDVVIVAASGRLAGYDLATGTPRWIGPNSGSSYSSPQLLTIDGIAQVVLQTAKGASAVAPTDGKLLWEHAWEGGSTIVQPALVGEHDILVTALTETGGQGLRRLTIAHEGGAWSVKERWTSAGLKPYFNDLVIHKGHAYGFDGNILACIRLEDGQRVWKGGRYGNGQLVLLADEDVLLVISEEGELALVSATADQFKEMARIPAIEGKTWNHPVLVRDMLLVRNDREMAAFRLALADKASPSASPAHPGSPNGAASASAKIFRGN